MKKHLSQIFLLLITSLSLSANALTISESFTSNTNKGSSTGMVWNIALGELHPPLRVNGWDDGGGPQNTLYDVGDGRHGAFGPSTYSTFDINGVISGGVIEIDTDTYSNLQFTSFNLAAGYILRPVGSSPLVIRVQSTMQIDGEINCSGGAGQNANTTTSDTRIGGVARCGGGDGGDSVPASVAPGASHSGVSSGVGPTGGAGGGIRLATGGQGGGGGGAFIKAFAGGADKPDPTDGDDSSGGGGGGLAGAIVRDDSFTVDADGGGSGGGGGSGFDHPGDPVNQTSGSGGGAGGGTIKIYAVGNITVSATGSIHADGGNGGLVAAGKGGSGGGGGGGSIVMFTGGDIVLDGAVTAAAGSGGATAGGAGGDGAWGRTWVVEKDGFAAGGIIEDPDSKLNVPGNVNYETGVTYTVLSKAIDMGNTIPEILTAPITTVNIGGSTLTYELAFSESADLSGLSSFASAATYLGTKQKRFGRFKIQIDNTNATTPFSITDLSLTFDGHQQDEFDLTTGCGRVAASPGQNSTNIVILLLLLTPICLLSRLRTKISPSSSVNPTRAENPIYCIKPSGPF